MKSLINAKSGDICTIKWMIGNEGIMNWIRGYQIEEGSKIRIIGQCLDSVIIGFGGIRLALGREVAERIKI